MVLANPYYRIISEFGSLLLDGIRVTLILSLVGTIIGLLLAFVFAVIRVQTINENDSKIVKCLKKIGILLVKGYVNVIRGTPMIVQAMIFFYGFYQIGLQWSGFAAGLFTVSVNTTAYLTEVLRGGITSVDKGQLEAARALGMNQRRAMIYVVLPQALKNSFASIGNEFIINIKDTSVLSTIMIIDLFSAANKAAGKTYYYLEAMLIAALIYLVITTIVSKILIFVEKKIGAPVKEITSSN